MPCGNVWVTSAVSGVPSGYAYMCWPDDGSGPPADNEPPTSGGGGAGISDGSTAFNIPGPAGDTGGTDLNPTGTIVTGGTEVGVPKPPTLSPNIGWNGGAHSVDSLPANWNGKVSFDIPDVGGARQGGVAVGFVPVSDLPITGRNGYDHMPYGLVFTTDYVRVIHDGEMVLELDYADLRALREVGVTTDKVEALMYGQFVKWVVNGETVYGGLFRVLEDYALDATLYLALDAVDNPVFAEGEWGDDIEDGSYNGVLSGLSMDADMSVSTGLSGSLGALAAQYSDGIVWNLTGGLRGLGYAAGDSDGLTGSLGSVQMIASDIPGYTPYTGALRSMSMSGGMSEPDGSVDYAVLYGSLGRVGMSAGIPPLAKLQGSMKPLQMVATFDSSYFEIRGTLGGLRMVAYGGENTPLINVQETIGTFMPASQSTYVALVMVERIGGETEALIYTTVTAEGMSAITAEDITELSTTLLEAAMELIGIGERATVMARRTDGSLQDDSEAWVVNTRTKASSRYDQYGFNSFATVRGRQFGMRSDGLSLLEGEDDVGYPIKSGLNLGKHDFGTMQEKAVRSVYAGVSSTGCLFMKISDGRQEFTYRALRAESRMNTQRFDPGRGLRSNYFTFVLVSEADAFELDTVEFDVVASERRI